MHFHDDWSVSRDRGYRLACTIPWDIARNYDGSVIAISQASNGVGVWYS